jgi:hypothetical protein
MPRRFVFSQFKNKQSLSQSVSCSALTSCVTLKAQTGVREDYSSFIASIASTVYVKKDEWPLSSGIL